VSLGPRPFTDIYHNDDFSCSESFPEMQAKGAQFAYDVKDFIKVEKKR
jgi:hypothetical protein